MCRFLLACLLGLAAPSLLLADAFDRYTNPLLLKVPAAEGVKELTQLTPAMMADFDRVLPGITGAMIVVRTNEDRWAKLIVQAARHKVGEGQTTPILLIDRFVTFKEGQERTVQVSGKNVFLFPGFRFHLDIGQVVPDPLTADLRFVSAEGKSYLETVGKAKMYLLTKPLPGATPEKAERPEPGRPFEPRFFNGTYKLYDDGRRSGSLKLEVAENGEISGAYYSDKDGQKYVVRGRIGAPNYVVHFTVQFPRTEQDFTGFLFTGDGSAMAGSSKMLDREAGFYAVRVVEGK